MSDHHSLSLLLAVWLRLWLPTPHLGRGPPVAVAVRSAGACQGCDAVTPAGGPVVVSEAGTGERKWVLIAALAAVYVVWGSTYLVMRIAVESLPPMLMGAIRFSIGWETTEDQIDRVLELIDRALT